MEKVGVNNYNEFYKGKKVFVTGHTGFKGSWLLCWLHLLEAQIKGFALLPNYNADFYDEIKSKVKFEEVIADIRDYNKLEKELLDFKPDIIFHLAAQPLVRESYSKPTETFEINTIGTSNLLEAVNKLEQKCTVILITTDKVYENKEIDYFYNEDDRLGGYDPYSASKAAAEIVISSFRNSFFNDSSFPIHQKKLVSVRAGNVIGGGDYSKDRLVPDIIKSLSTKKEIEIRNPNSIRPWQHVLEPINGYLKLAMLAYIDNTKISDAYNFGPLPDDHLDVATFVQTAINCWGNGVWKDISNSNELHEAGVLKLDITKSGKELEWYPKLDSKKAIEWTLEWFKNDVDKFEITVEQIKKYIS